MATFTQYLSVWNLNNTPASPPLIGNVSILTPNNTNRGQGGDDRYIQVHEIFVKSLTSNTAKLYVAGINAGLQIMDVTLNTSSVTVNNRIEHLYDFDKAYPNSINSVDGNFEFSVTHSSWPTDDGNYVFTTDEISLWPPDYGQFYSPEDIDVYPSISLSLKTPRRQGSFLKIWKTSELGTGTSLKNWLSISKTPSDPKIDN